MKYLALGAGWEREGVGESGEWATSRKGTRQKGQQDHAEEGVKIHKEQEGKRHKEQEGKRHKGQET